MSYDFTDDELGPMPVCAGCSGYCSWTTGGLCDVCWRENHGPRCGLCRDLIDDDVKDHDGKNHTLCIEELTNV